jgi:hypothetical protein
VLKEGKPLKAQVQGRGSLPCQKGLTKHLLMKRAAIVDFRCVLTKREASYYPV